MPKRIFGGPAGLIPAVPEIVMFRLAFALALALSASACAVRYDDGAGDLWKAPACVQRGAC